MNRKGAPAHGSPRPFRAKWRPPDYVTGRPTLYRPEYCEAVISVMGEGYDLTAFAGSIGVSREAVYDWIDAHAEFRHAVNIAKSARLFALQRKLLNTQIGVGVTAAIFALKNADPENWQDRYNTTTDVNVRIEKLSDEQLDAIIAQHVRSGSIEHDVTPQLTHADERQPVATEDK
jgi:hypothetical protein